MVWYSYLFKDIPQLLVVRTVKGLGIVNEAEVDVFLDFPCFLCDATDVGNFMSSSSTFSKPSLYLEVVSSCTAEV